MKEVYKETEMAEMLNCSVGTLRHKTKLGIIPGAKVGRRYVYIWDDVKYYLRDLYACPTSQKTPDTFIPSSWSADKELDELLANRLVKKPNKKKRAAHR